MAQDSASNGVYSYYSSKSVMLEEPGGQKWGCRAAEQQRSRGRKVRETAERPSLGDSGSTYSSSSGGSSGLDAQGIGTLPTVR